MTSLTDSLSIQEKTKRMIRVNLAGEYGAKRIYEGQIAALKSSSCLNELEHMKEQELQHLEGFTHLAQERRVRPTLLSPLWHVAGYALGFTTGLLGEKTAMACTAAVEEVIDEHYTNQLNELQDKDPTLSTLIEKFQQEEREHRDIALMRGAESAPGHYVITQAIKMGSRLAIWLSTRL